MTGQHSYFHRVIEIVMLPPFLRGRLYNRDLVQRRWFAFDQKASERYKKTITM